MGGGQTEQGMDGGNRDPGSLSGHDSEANDEKTTLIGSVSTDQPVQVHHSWLLFCWQLILNASTRQLMKAHVAAVCGAIRQVKRAPSPTPGETGGTDAAEDWSAVHAGIDSTGDSQDLMLRPRLAKINGSATYFFLQTITRLKEEIRQIEEIACSVAAEKDKIEKSKHEATVELHTKLLEQVARDRMWRSQIDQKLTSLYNHISQLYAESAFDPNKASALQRSNPRRSSTSTAARPALTNLPECADSLVKSIGAYFQDLEKREEESRVMVAEMNLKKADDAVLVMKRQKTQYIQDDRLFKEKQEGGLRQPTNSAKQKETELAEYYQREMKLQEENLRESFRSETQRILQEMEAMAKQAQYYEQECGKLKNQIDSSTHCHMSQMNHSSTKLQQQQKSYQAELNKQQKQHEAEIAHLMNRVKKLEKGYKEAHSRMQKAEQFIADQAIVDSASYPDNSATPMLLQASADGVKSAISMCASSILKFTTKHSLPIDFNLNPCSISTLRIASDQHDQLDLSIGHMNRKMVVKMALQAFLCELLFQGFESSTFSFSMVSFEKPEIRRKQRFQDYLKLKYMEPVEACGKDPEFNSFVKQKAESMGYEIRKLILMQVGTNAHHDARQAHQELLNAELLSASPSNPFYKSFLRLAKAVWQLHELAFAFEPASAEILRVAPNSVFLREYMEEHEDTRLKTVTLQEVEDEDSKKLVTLMNVPGFTVRNSVIRSIVCCMPSQITN